jgi:MFS family permease
MQRVSGFQPGIFGRSSHILGILAASYTVSFVDRALVGVACAPIKTDLGLTDSQFGLLHGMAFVALYCLCAIPLGWLADRTDRRAMIAAGLLFWSIMTALCGLTHSFAGFFIARIGVGFGEACLIPAGMSLLASVTPKARMARSVTIFLMGATFGNVLALLIGGYLLTRLGAMGPITLPGVGVVAPWRVLFLLACLPGLAMAALVLMIREPARAMPGSSENQFKAAALHLYVNRRAYGFLTAATACSLTLAQAQAAWMPLFYVRHFGLSPGESAMTNGVMFLLSAPAGQWAGGFMIDRLRAKGNVAAPHVVLALCAFCCVPAAFIFCTTRDIRLSELAYVIFNFFAFAATPAGLTGWQLLTPDVYRGLLIAFLVSVVTMIGVGLGPLLVGMLTDYVFRDQQALGLSLFAIITVAGLVGCFLAMTGRRSFTSAVQLHRAP